MTGTIYIIKNTFNKAVYIGQTTLSVKDRFMQHMKPSAHKKTYKFYRAINNIGREKFYYEILEENIPIDKLDEREIYYIEKYNSFHYGYNSTKGGDGRIINKIKDLDYIVQELEKGRYSTDIAKELGISTATIKRALKKINLKPSDFRAVDRISVIDMYSKGVPISDIAKKLNINVRTVSRVISDSKIPNRHKLTDLSVISKEEIYNLHVNGMKQIDIAKKYNLNPNYVSKAYLKIKNQKETQSTIQ